MRSDGKAMESRNQEGFTLVELMVAMAIAGLLVSLVSLAYTSQSSTYNSQQDALALQQDMRSALQFLAKEIRMAGFDPRGDANAGITVAMPTACRFSQDVSDGAGGESDGNTSDPNEDIRYGINSSGSLGRETSGTGGLQPVAENVVRLLFEYRLDDGTWLPAVTTAKDRRRIRAVKIMIQGHSARETARVTDHSKMNPPLESASAPDWTPVSPGRYHWRLMSLIVQCRNLQIKK